MNITINELSVADLAFSHTKNNTNEPVWNPDGISLAARFQADPGFHQKIQKSIGAEALTAYIVPVQISAPTRCIDGRRVVGWSEMSDQEKAFLGPKVPGGTPHAALSYRLANTEDIGDLQIEDDIKHVIEANKQFGVGFGGHVDTHRSDLRTGCGAVDNMITILDKILNPAAGPSLGFLAYQVMGDKYSEEIFNETLDCIGVVRKAKATYLPEEYGQSVVDLQRSEADGVDNVPALDGDHREVAVVLNWRNGTTIDTDRFTADHGDDIQVFGWDIWEMHEEAKRLYPGSARKRKEHLMARTLLGMATAMVLTDGSLRLVTVQ